MTPKWLSWLGPWCWCPQMVACEVNATRKLKYISHCRRMKAEMGRVREKRRVEERRVEERRSEKRKSQKKEDAGARKGRKVAKHCVFPMICGSGGSKSRLAKAAGAEPAGQMRDEKLHAVVAGSTFEVKMYKTRFGPLLEVEMSKKCTPLWPEAHFEVKMYKTRFGPLLEVEMSKKCTPLWPEAHFEVKMHKARFGPLLEVEMSKKCTPLWREEHRWMDGWIHR